MVLSLVTASAWAQKVSKIEDSAHPTKPVTLLVPQTAGGTNEFVARVLAAKLAEITSQGFVLENKPGAGGNGGTQIAAKAPKDGYTLLAKALDDKNLQARLAGQGAEMAKPTYGKALAKVLREDIVKWDVMVTTSGAKVD